MTQDGWVDIYGDVAKAGHSTSGAIFFMVYIVIGGFVFANIIAGVTVTNLQSAYNEMKMMKKVRHRALDEGDENQADEKNDDGPGDEDNNSKAKPQIQSISHVRPAVWKNQTPMQTPDFHSLTIPALENYILVLVAIEECLQEREALKEKLYEVSRVSAFTIPLTRQTKILSVVKDLNDSGEGEEAENEAFISDDEDDFVADALTRVMMKEREQNQRLEV
jgi:cation channel sperm-associated protein 4